MNLGQLVPVFQVTLCSGVAELLEAGAESSVCYTSMCLKSGVDGWEGIRVID